MWVELYSPRVVFLEAVEAKLSRDMEGRIWAKAACTLMRVQKFRAQKHNAQQISMHMNSVGADIHEF